MSSGDLDQTPANLDDWHNLLAACPAVVADIQREITISTTYDQPYLSGYTTTGRPILIDQRVPRFAQIKESWIYLFKYLVVHETVESALIRILGYDYEKAHHFALAAEKEAVEADGISWDDYQAIMVKLIEAVEIENIQLMPADQDLTPWLSGQDSLDERLLPAIRLAMTKDTDVSVFTMPTNVEVVVKSVNKEKQIVYGEVYTPYVIDTHNEMMLPEDVELMAHRFMSTLKNDRIDIMHNNQLIEAVAVESYIARASDPLYHEGAWVLAVKIVDKEIWQQIKDGEFNGYSIETLVTKVPAIVDVTYLPHIFGFTQKVDGHEHAFFIQVDDNGVIAGGTTSKDSDHLHKICSATATEMYEDHAHRIELP